jgi:hypothetical protein
MKVNYPYLFIIRFADIALLPPPNGVIVKALALPIGLFILKTEFVVVVNIKQSPII